MIWKYFYDTNSASEHGTLYQLRNKINRTNVVTNPKSNYNACGDFLETVIVAHILSAAMKILGISNLDDQPSDDVIGTSAEHLWTLTDKERKKVMDKVCEKMVDEFVGFSFNVPPDNIPQQDIKCSVFLFGI